MNDTKQYIPNSIDLQYISDYFQERVIKKDTKYHVLFSYIDSKIRYSEDQAVTWVLYSDIKVIGGVKCQKAATNLFGRRWIAYFAKEKYPQAIGPYKFAGLPGLIMEIHDTRGDYHFTVSKIKKNTSSFTINLDSYKNYPKNYYLKAKHNLEYEGAGFPDMTSELRRQYEETAVVLKRMFNNPIELKPL